MEIERRAGHGQQVDDAIELTQVELKHIGELEAARKDRNYDALMTAAADIGKTCGTCHTLYSAGTDGNYGPNLDELLAGTYDEDALAGQGYGHERLDQLVTELLLGAR